MAKKITGYIKLQVPAGQANPSPPIGPALGQAGLNIMEFCKAFNAHTQNMDQGVPIPTVISVYADRSFSFITKTPPASYFIKQAARLPKGSETPGREVVARDNVGAVIQGLLPQRSKEGVVDDHQGTVTLGPGQCVGGGGAAA